MKILKISNLNKIYHDKNSELTALKDITFDLEDKEFLSIVGPSGCGKSTILSILAGISDKSSGNILYKDHCKIGYMLQKDSLFPWKTVLDNCLIGLKIQGNLNDSSQNMLLIYLKLMDLKNLFINILIVYLVV